MEAVIGDTQQGGCLLSLKEEKEEKRDGGGEMEGDEQWEGKRED